MRECFLLVLCFWKLPNIAHTRMSKPGRNEHLQLPVRLHSNSVCGLSVLSCQGRCQDMGKLDGAGYGLNHALSLRMGDPSQWTGPDFPSYFSRFTEALSLSVHGSNNPVLSK